MISAHITSSTDQIMVVDPMGEYKDMAKALNGQVISFDTGRDIYLNPMDVDFKGANLSDLRDIISDKADFILTLLSICLKRDLTTLEQGIIDSESHSFLQPHHLYASLGCSWLNKLVLLTLHDSNTYALIVCASFLIFLYKFPGFLNK